MIFLEVKDVTGKIVGASNVARDISDRAKNDQSRFQLAAIVDSADDAIVSKDLNGIVRTWNLGAVRMFGYTPEEMVEAPITWPEASLIGEIVTETSMRSPPVPSYRPAGPFETLCRSCWQSSEANS